MQEEWMPIENFPDYVVSNYGYVQNVVSGRMLGRSPVQSGMMTVAMMYDKLQYRRSLASLVARAFLLPPIREDFNTPIHLDGDKKNCRADNLMWRPRWFAINYHIQARDNRFKVWTKDFRLNETGEIFEHPREPAQKYGLLESEIHKALVNQTPVFPTGFTFMFMED